jgi:GntR family transcriptional repressor for pyruvate dehydrogenase complex
MVRRALLPEWERLQQLLDFRCTVESEIARLAAERRTPAEARLVERASDEYLQSDMNREASQRADVALHRAITRAAHNPCWEQLSVQLRHEVNQGLGTEPYSPALRQRAEREHPELAAAVVAGDPDAAASSARRHFGLNGQTIDELLSSLGRDPVPAPSGASRPRRKENL